MGTGEGGVVGTDVGWAENVGSAEGGVVGVDVGRFVAVVGSRDGIDVGVDVGTFVGAENVGIDVGVDVGTFVGAENVGIDVGVDVGSVVGAGLGAGNGAGVGQLSICTTPHDVGAHKGWAEYIWRPPQQAEERPTPHSSQSKRHLFAQENQRIGIGGLVASCHQPGMLKLVGKL